MDSYIILRSDDNKEMFPENRPYDFVTQLPFQLILDGTWEIGLTEITLSNEDVSRDLYVCSNLVDESIVGQYQMKILRRVVFSISNQMENQIFNLPYFLPIRVRNTKTVHVFIKDRQDELASFLTKPVTVVLQLRRVGHFIS